MTVPAPFSTNELTNSKISEGGKSQKETLFNLGNAINFCYHKALYPCFLILLLGSDYVIG